MNVGVIISAIENAPIPYSAPEVIKGIRDGRHLMYFGDISELKIYDMPLAVTRKFKKPIETGDGYYIKENECIKLKNPVHCGRVGYISGRPVYINKNFIGGSNYG